MLAPHRHSSYSVIDAALSLYVLKTAVLGKETRCMSIPHTLRTSLTVHKGLQKMYTLFTKVQSVDLARKMLNAKDAPIAVREPSY